MSVIPVSRLSCSDLTLLGNNVRPARGPGVATAALCAGHAHPAQLHA